MARISISDFGVIQKAFAGATVAIYNTDAYGESTGVLATIYQASTGTGQRSNPQVLDENGQLTAECWVESTVLAEISGLTEATERSVRKLRANPLQYPLVMTSSALNIADTEAASTTAIAAAATATTQAGIATTQAGIATTQAGIATTQAGIATTQAGIATTKAAEALASEGIATTKAAEASSSAAAAAASAAGMKRKAPVRAATTAALAANTYANGTAGVGATLTASANGALAAQDGVTLLVGEGLLVKNEATASRNGIYIVTQVGTAGTPYILTRQTDSDTWNEIVAAVVTVMEGSTQADLDYLCTSNAGGTMGTTNITWQAYNSTISDGAVSTAAKIVDGIITPQKLSFAVPALSPILPVTASVAANALTLTLNACSLDFRSATAGSGTVNTRTVASPISLVISSGSTLGTINGQQSRIVIIAIDNAGTVELAAVNQAGGTNLDETGLISTTAEGGAGAADSATVVYSTTARSNVPYRVVGYVTSTQATAGTWATSPSNIQGTGGQNQVNGSIGYGQTWQSVTRNAGTTYYNTTGKPIMYQAEVAATIAAVWTSTISINGGGAFAFASGPGVANARQCASIIIPVGASYVFADTNCTRTSMELR